MGIDRLTDEQPRRADDLRDDVIAQRQREGEDGWEGRLRYLRVIGDLAPGLN